MIELFWIPLGAGGSGFVRAIGWAYECLQARLDHRGRLAIYHTALRVQTPDGRFVVEMVLPSRKGDPSSRGVVFEGAVAAAPLARIRLLRYEFRCWRDGILLDEEPGAVGPQTLSDDLDQARGLLEAMKLVPRLIWGRDQLNTGEMWNSNSVISWLIAMAGVPVDDIHAPAGARAPGWDAGVVAARRAVPLDPSGSGEESASTGR